MSAPSPGSQEAESVIHRYFTAFQRHALEEMLPLLDENMRGIYPNEPHREWKGRESATGVLRNYFSQFPDLKLEWRVEKSEPEPDGRGVGFYMRNRISATGMEERRMYLKYIVSGGRITQVVHLG
jgi:ketosteroid isomerase-like protein